MLIRYFEMQNRHSFIYYHIIDYLLRMNREIPAAVDPASRIIITPYSLIKSLSSIDIDLKYKRLPTNYKLLTIAITMKIINVLLVALVVISSRHYRCCDAFQCIRTSSSGVVPSLQASTNNRKVGYHETTGMMMAKLPLPEEEVAGKTRPYTEIEDGSLVGVFTVACGFFLVQYFGNTIENKDFINEYGVIIILLAGSTAAGISRFVRNK